MLHKYDAVPRPRCCYTRPLYVAAHHLGRSNPPNNPSPALVRLRPDAPGDNHTRQLLLLRPPPNSDAASEHDMHTAQRHMHHHQVFRSLPLPFTLAARCMSRISLSPESLVTPSSRNRFRPIPDGDIAYRDVFSGGTGGGSDSPPPPPPPGAGAERKSNQSGAPAEDEDAFEPCAAPVRWGWVSWGGTTFSLITQCSEDEVEVEETVEKRTGRGRRETEMEVCWKCRRRSYAKPRTLGPYKVRANERLPRMHARGGAGAPLEGTAVPGHGRREVRSLEVACVGAQTQSEQHHTSLPVLRCPDSHALREHSRTDGPRGRNLAERSSGGAQRTHACREPQSQGSRVPPILIARNVNARRQRPATKGTSAPPGRTSRKSKARAEGAQRRRAVGRGNEKPTP